MNPTAKTQVGEKEGGFKRKPSPLARCKLAVDRNPYAGEMLYQLAYRFARKEALVLRHGKWWCAQTGRNWQVELALTVEQYKTAIRILKASGLIEHRLEKFSEHQLYSITWVRLTEKGQGVTSGLADGKQLAWMTPSGCGNDANHIAPSTPGFGVDGSCTGNSTTGNKPKGKKAKSLAGGEGETGQQDEEETEEGGSGGASGNKPTKKQIETMWLNAHKAYRPELSVSPFIGPDWAFAETIAFKLGADAEPVIDGIVKEWIGFVEFVIVQTHHKMSPQRPTLAYVSLHATLGRDFIKASPPPVSGGLGGFPVMKDEL